MKKCLAGIMALALFLPLGAGATTSLWTVTINKPIACDSTTISGTATYLNLDPEHDRTYLVVKVDDNVVLVDDEDSETWEASATLSAGSEVTATIYAKFLIFFSVPLATDSAIVDACASETLNAASITSTSTTQTSLAVTADTNLPAQSKLQYGVTPDLGSESAPTDLGTSGTMMVEGLTCNTLYYFKVVSSDDSFATSIPTSVEEATTTACEDTGGDDTGDTLNSVQIDAVSTTTASVSVTFTTNIPATSRLQYGATAELGSTTTGTTAGTLSLSELACDTDYYFKVESSNDDFATMVASDVQSVTLICESPDDGDGDAGTPPSTFGGNGGGGSTGGRHRTSTLPVIEPLAEVFDGPTPQVLGVEILQFNRDLSFGNRGEDVKALQQFLIDHNAGPAARRLARIGTTGYFGPYTRAALIEYQRSVNLTPTGRFDTATRAYVNGLGQ